MVLVPGQQIGIQCAATLVSITLDNEANETRSQKLTNKLHFHFHYSGSTCIFQKNDDMRKKQGQELHKQQSIENARQEQDSEKSPRTGLQAIYYEHDVSIRMVRSNLLHTRRYIRRRENVVASATRGKIFLHSKSLIHNSSRITSMKASMQATFHLFFFLFHSDNEASKRPILELHYICHGLCSRDY